MFRTIFLLGIYGFSFIAFANDAGFQDAINAAKETAGNKKLDSYNLAKQFDPRKAFDNYSSDPKQKQYYQGVMQQDVKQLEYDALNEQIQGSGKEINKVIQDHPRYVINKNDPDIARGQLLQQEAYNILHGMTSQYVDCKPQEICKTQFQEKICQEAPQAIFQTCKKKLNVEVIAHESVTHYPLSAHLSVREHNYAGISINAITGGIGFLGPHDARFSLDGRLPANIDCSKAALTGQITRNYGGANLDHITFPTCEDGFILDFHISGGHGINLDLDIASKIITYEVNDQWIDECTAAANDDSCTLTSKQCEIPQSTKVIQGIPVTRDCWEYKSDYICRLGNGEGNCKPLQNEGCEQLNSVCIDKNKEGRCVQYQQTYRCAIKTCSPTSDVICGNGKEYCLDGNCTDQSYKESADFARGVSAVSATAAAGKDLDRSSLTIFTGHSAECSEKPIGYSNCCTKSGWGQDAGLDHCPDSAKQLHKDRENKLAIKVGRYCSGPDPFPCIVHSQVFCVFNSKLAKIIQEQGRRNQLGVGFGRAKEPLCTGISPEQLQAIDLAKIDFSDFVSDLSAKIKTPNLDLIKEMIQRHVQEYQQKKRANDE